MNSGCTLHRLATGWTGFRTAGIQHVLPPFILIIYTCPRRNWMSGKAAEKSKKEESTGVDKAREKGESSKKDKKGTSTDQSRF